MRYFILLFLLFQGLTTGWAQTFNTHWIASPVADSTSQVWFKQTYRLPERPQKAILTVVSTGYFAVYVNKWKVDLATIAPYRAFGDTTTKGIRYDITRYMRRDSNTIAVWYSPLTPAVERRQLSLTLTTTDQNGLTTAHNTDRGWLCHAATRRLNAQGGEDIDGLGYAQKWTGAFNDIALWQPAVEIQAAPSAGYTVEDHFRPQLKATRIRTQNYFDVVGDTVYYEFGTGFYGTLRLTLRNARRGQILHIGHHSYRCNGKTDEQAISRFAPSFYRRVAVWGDNHFNPRQIQAFEAIEQGAVWPSTADFIYD